MGMYKYISPRDIYVRCLCVQAYTSCTHLFLRTSLYQLYAPIFVYKFYKLYAPILCVHAYTSCTHLFCVPVLQTVRTYFRVY